MNKKFTKNLSILFFILSTTLFGYVVSFETKNPIFSAIKQLVNPEIIDIKWGEITIKYADGTIYNYKDCKISPTIIKAWDWSITGTRHEPGIQISDIEELLDSSDIIILTTGMLKKLKVKRETIAYLRNKNKAFCIRDTKAAVVLFNKLSKLEKKLQRFFTQPAKYC